MESRTDDKTRMVRVLLADGTPKVRSALKLLLEQDEGIAVNTAVGSVRGLLEQVGMCCPEAVLLDCDLSGAEVGEVLPQLRSLCPHVRVIALCSRPEMRQAALSAGVDAFVCKDESPEKLLDVLRTEVGTWSDCLKPR
jgi:DNA-binding NarL/FixJ family response regulator